MRYGFILYVLLTTLAFSQTNHERLQSLKEVKRIAFGSCNNENAPQPLWKDMIQQKPDLFIWVGDAVYADWNKSHRLARSYQKQNSIPDYIQMKQQTAVIGTWDDHDFAYDNAGGTTVFKKISQELFLDFYDVPEDSPRRLQEGIYTSHEFKSSGKKIKFLMLDNRYFKDIEPNAPLLGEAQWQWLENELKNSTAALHFIATGLPVVGPEIPYTEEWAHYPREMNRLLNLIKTYNPQGVMIITGDKHFSSIYKRWGVLEFMSSGMTHGIHGGRMARWYLNRKFPNTYFGLSYGQIDIHWEGSTPHLTLSKRSVWGEDIHKTRVKWQGNQWLFY